MSTSARGIVAYSAYLPRYRLARADIAAALNSVAGRGERVAASFDEDSTTLGVAAAHAALGLLGPAADNVPALYFATTTPAYADKTNATAIHAAVGLPDTTFAADVAGAARSGVAALRAAATGGGMAVLADVIVGRPGSADEAGGADAAAAFVFGPTDGALAEILATTSLTAEFLDRWRRPGATDGVRWEERFGLDRYAPLVERAVKQALADAGLAHADHAVVVSTNSAVAARARSLVRAAEHVTGSPVGYAGAATLGVALADVLDRARPGQTIALVSASDGVDVLVLRTGDRITDRRARDSVTDQLAGGRPVPYPTYLGWRGLLDREPPRRPEPDRVSGPASARSVEWKFGLTANRCTDCGFVHLPPVRVCKNCAAVDQTTPIRFAGRPATVATYTVDRLAYSPAPPVVEAVVDFDGGGRFTFEVADADPDALTVGSRVETVFRRLSTAGGVHNYFWKVRMP